MKSPQILQNIISKLAILNLLLLLIPSTSSARDVDLSWTANPEPVSGYKLYYKTGTDSAAPYDGTGLTEGSSPIDVGKVTAFSVTGLSPDEIYHFTLTAISDQDESDYTAPVTYQPLSMASPTIIIMSQNI